MAEDYDPIFLDDDGIDNNDDAEPTDDRELDGKQSASQISFDIPLSVIDQSEAALRFNGEGKYNARSSGVEVRCVVADQAHGQVSADNTTPCSLLVFDFTFDRRRLATVHKVSINLILHGGVKVHGPHGVAPDRTISFNPQKVTRGQKDGTTFKLGASYMATAEAGKTNEETENMELTEYAHAQGWTKYWPRERFNDPSPHNCVYWAIDKNLALKEQGLPRHFRGAVLLERPRGVNEFELEMVIESTADMLSTLQNKLRGSIPAGRLVVDASLPPTNNLRSYDPTSVGQPILLGAIGMQDFAELSQGRLQERIFDRSGLAG